MRCTAFLFLTFLIIGCAKENPTEPSRPTNLRLKTEYTTGVLDHVNMTFGVYITVETRTDIDSVDIWIYQSRPPTENGLYRRVYSQTYTIPNSQLTVDSVVVIGNPFP